MSKQDSDHVAAGAQRQTDDSVCLCVHTHLHSVNPHEVYMPHWQQDCGVVEVLQRDL